MKPADFELESLLVFLQFIFDGIDKGLPTCLYYIL